MKRGYPILSRQVDLERGFGGATNANDFYAFSGSLWPNLAKSKHVRTRSGGANIFVVDRRCFHFNIGLNLAWLAAYVGLVSQVRS